VIVIIRLDAIMHFLRSMRESKALRRGAQRSTEEIEIFIGENCGAYLGG